MTPNVISHRKFKRALDEAKTCATHAAAGKVIFVTGPSGAGKSTLKKQLSNELYGPRERWPDNKVLLCSVRATNSESGYFSSKDFFSRMLTSLDDPFRGGLSEVAAAAVANGKATEVQKFLADPLWRSIRVSMTEMKIRCAFECLGTALGLRAILIDEGQSMCLTHSNRNPSDHLESLKCLAEEMGILIFIFGTYDLLEIWNHSSQLNRRSQLIHLSRYDDAIEADRSEFYSLLRMFGNSMDLEDLRVLGKHAEEIHSWTYGVVGEVNALFERASILAYAEGAEKIAWVHIQRAAYNPAQLKRLSDEIAFGEARVRGGTLSTTANSHRGRPVSARSVRHPGKRNPVRDLCGKRV